MSSVRRNPLTVAIGPAGTGKALQNGTLVLGPEGARPIETLTIGDTIYDAASQPSLVTGVFPQGVTDCYKVTFKDGRSVNCSSDHLWSVIHYEGQRVVPLSVILARKDWKRFGIPLFTVESAEVELPLDPYLVGVLIGDGYLAQKTTKLSTADYEVVKAFSDYSVHQNSKYDYTISGLSSTMRELGLQGCLAYDKKIPEEYMRAGTEQRWSLLQGLMDTDGTVGLTKGLAIQFSNEYLSKQVQELVWSLGGVCKLSKRSVTYTYQGSKHQGADAWRCSIRFNTPEKAFRLARHKKRCEGYQYKDRVTLRIDSIERLPDCETTCISVSSPSRLFVVDDYIVTHNTYCAVGTAASLFQQGKVRKLVLTRANVPTGRTLGSFPGDIHDKLAPWLAPMLSVLSDRLGKNVVENQLRLGNIELQPLETIRGRSFDNAIVLVDEAQNLTMEEIKAVTTRLGDGSRMVLMGDPQQSDLRGSALNHFGRLLLEHDLDAGVVYFTVEDIVRSDIVGQLARMFLAEKL